MVEVRSGRLSLELDEATGSIRRVADLASGSIHLDAAGERARFGRLFRVIAPKPRWGSRQLDSWTSPPPRIEQRKDGLDLSWQRLDAPTGPLPVRADVALRCSPDTSEVTLRLTLHNEGDTELTDVLFPWLGGLLVADGTAPSLTLGGVRQMDITGYPRNLGLTFQRWHQRDLYTYPVDLYCPWIDYSGARGGMGLISWQREARNVAAAIENLAGYGPGLVPSVAMAHFPAVAPGGSWVSPELALTVHDGDWRQTADRYTAWVEEWLPEPRTPVWARRSIGFQNVMFRSFEGRPIRAFSEIPSITRHGLEHGVDHLCVWDYVTLGDYSKFDDVPRHGFGDLERAELRDALAGARALGAHVSALENFRLVKPRSRLWLERLEDEACRRYDGSPYVEEYCSSGTHGRVIVGHVGPYVHPIDARGPRYREHVLALVRDSLELGFDSLFHDQPFENWPSYAAIRGSDGPDGPDGAHAGVISLLAEIRELIRDSSPEGILVGEYCDVFATPSVDSWMSWYTDPDDLERSVYSIPRTLQSIVVDSDPVIATRGFLVGAQLCLTTHGCESTLADEPTFGRHVGALARLRRELSDRAGTWRLLSGPLEDTSDGPATARAFSSPRGPFVICASPGAPGRLVVRLDSATFPSASGATEVSRLDGRRDRVGGEGSFELTLGTNDVAIVWPETST